MFVSRASRARSARHAGHPTAQAAGPGGDRDDEPDEGGHRSGGTLRPRRRRRRSTRPSPATITRAGQVRCRRSGWSAAHRPCSAPVDDEDRPARPALRTGKVRVIRHAFGYGAQVRPPSARLVQGRRAREEAGGVAVGPHAEPDQVEARGLVAARIEGADAQLALVGERRGIEVGRLGLHAVDPLGSDVRELADEHLEGRRRSSTPGRPAARRARRPRRTRPRLQSTASRRAGSRSSG